MTVSAPTNCQGCNMYDLDDIDSYCVDCVQPCEACDTYVITREKVDVPLSPPGPPEAQCAHAADRHRAQGGRHAFI